tara:strand:- start:1857 stop:2162 length:306 start_codon:yes stop_codon:yes gene_type:complete
MRDTVSEYRFVQAFDDMGREANFSRLGRFALYEYLTDLEDDCGIEIELDVIAICCDFTEFENLEEFQESYGDWETIEDIETQTTVIAGYDDDRFIIRSVDF